MWNTAILFRRSNIFVNTYINKGSDQATFDVRNPNDEVENCLNGRHLSRYIRSGLENIIISYTRPSSYCCASGRTLRKWIKGVLHGGCGPSGCTLVTSQKHYYTMKFPNIITWANNAYSRKRRSENVDGHPGIKKDAALERIYGVHPSQSECFYLKI